MASSVKSDIEIAQAATREPIENIGAKLGMPDDALIRYGHDKAKVRKEFIASRSEQPDGRLILVMPCRLRRPARVRPRRPSVLATA